MTEIFTKLTDNGDGTFGLPTIDDVPDTRIGTAENGDPVLRSTLTEAERQAIGLASLTVEDTTGYTPGQKSETLSAETGVSRTYPSKTAIPITAAQVQVECARRLALGFDYDFADARGVHAIGTTEKDMEGWREVTDLANALVNTNDTSTTIGIVTETGPCAVTGAEWQAILIAAAAFRQPIWAYSFALQAQSPIPQDYTDDSHWTESE